MSQVASCWIFLSAVWCAGGFAAGPYETPSGPSGDTVAQGIASSEADSQLLAEATFQRPSAGEFDRVRDQALREAEDLGRRLQSSASGEAWRQYLQMEELQQSLRGLRPVVPLSAETAGSDQSIDEARRRRQTRMEQVDHSAGRLMGNHEGLERAPLMRLRSSLHRLRLLDELQRDMELPERFAQYQTELIRLLGQPAGQRDVQWFRQVTPLVSWMQQYGQARPWTDRVAARWSKPNLRLGITKSAMRHMTTRQVYEVEPVDECDDGRRITGEAVATGVAAMVPLGGVDGPQCEVVFSGNVHTTLRGSDGPVSFAMVGDTQLRVGQPIEMSEAAFTLLPTWASSSTSLRPSRVATRRNGLGSRLIRKIAIGELQKAQPAARRDLDESTVQQLAEALTEDVQEEMDQAHGELQGGLVHLDRMDLHPNDLHFVAVPEQFEVQMTVNGGFGLGAPFSPPSAMSQGGRSSDRNEDLERPDLFAQVHESVVNRLAQRLLAGERIENFRSLAGTLGFSMSEQDLQRIPDDIGITFAKDRPIEARFEDGRIAITIRGTHYQIGRADLVPMNATIRYRIRAHRGKLALEMDGGPEVTPPESGRSDRFLAQKNILVRRLQQELPKQMVIAGFDMPEPADRLGQVRFRSISSAEGWLNLSLGGDWRRTAVSAAAGPSEIR